MVYHLLMTEPDTPLTEYQLSRIRSSHKVQCDLCRVWVDVDDIAWREPTQTLAICDECQEEGDEYR